MVDQQHEKTTPDPPVVLLPRTVDLPEVMRFADSWIVWRCEWKQEKSGWKLNKIPCDRQSGKNKGMDQQDGWSDLETALEDAQRLRQRREPIFGVGIVFHGDLPERPATPFTVADLDKCIGPGSKFDERAIRLTESGKTWSEVSVSGTGLHFCYAGHVEGKHKLTWLNGQIEIFGSAGFIAVTGNSDFPRTPVASLPKIIADLLATKENGQSKSKPHSNPFTKQATGGNLPSEQDIIDRMFAAKNGREIRELWDGGGLADISAGDLALCNHLAFWCDRNPEWIDRLFRKSSRMRPKWDEKHKGDGSTYGQMTIGTAIETCANVYDWRRRQSGTKGFSTSEPGESTEPAKERNTFGWKPDPIPFDAFMKLDCRHKWRIKRLIVANEPAIVFGPSKVLKTSLILDGCISLASGNLFLGFFETVPTRVLLISGESGQGSLQSIAMRIVQDRGINPDEIGDRLQIECSVPPLGDVGTLMILRDLLLARKPEILVIDPAYLTLLAGGEGGADIAKNVFGMGMVLGRLADLCRPLNIQLILLHHTNTTLRIGDKPELSHIAFAGFQQFCRQWIGLNRRTPFEHDGRHELIMVAGGSAGHCGEWHLAIDEGIMNDAFEGRKWLVQVEQASESRAHEQAERKENAESKREQNAQERKQQAQAKLEKEWQEDLKSAEELIGEISKTSSHGAATKSQLRRKLKKGNVRINDIVDHLLEVKRIISKPIEVESGHGKKEKTMGYLPSPADDLFHE